MIAHKSGNYLLRRKVVLFCFIFNGKKMMDFVVVIYFHNGLYFLISNSTVVIFR